MPIFLRALSLANAVREWFSFANEAVSFIGVTKRVAAAGVIAAAVAAPVMKPEATVQQLKAARQVVPAGQGSAEDVDLGECASGRCSTLYLVENADRMALARRIVSACETTTDVSLEQCGAAARAVAAFDEIQRQERRDAARRKAAAEAPPVGRLTMPWEHKK